MMVNVRIGQSENGWVIICCTTAVLQYLVELRKLSSEVSLLLFILSQS